MKNILQHPEPSLLIPSEAATMAEVPEIARKLREAASIQTLGVLGLAAPQIGINKQVFLVLDKIYVNPSIIKRDMRTQVAQESCFSVEGGVAIFPVLRNLRYAMTWLDETGTRCSEIFRVTKWQTAPHIIQHEYDHLKGVLCNG